MTSEPDGREERQDSPPDLSKRRLLLPLSHPDRVVDSGGEADDAAEQKAPFLAVADDIRQRSAAGELVDIRCFQEAPYSLDAQSVGQLFEQINASEACADILSINNGEERYYYSDRSMSHNYARILVFTHEQNVCKTIADTVRFECQTYPRPYKVQMLSFPPYSFDQEKIDGALRFFEQSDEFQDIRIIAASNGEPYLFSEHFMSYGKAKGLCEWIEVEQYENP
ncbi:YdhW family putative oxidoreductase system protein [Brenneria goodwinii]|uniref:YdhW family putative oxidoreductase system protein n=1 Tax=Brenneria goodwinii TaxID=1109412 RepID=UPI000F280C80|nr:YdhW family putative oxidoreductase system protein [Brenneria goodwinii]MCG8156991.1 YdhW family putative oxidoreductase system protein [Brenneria goodwinii]MCG8161342.1 YdhW family putative oxidoreductase system protein [Brenneria goodwinii]MCG8168043.1 YdhW family putative oxidoreductase system protein [Brenneria goodwinii]MCG8172719.1 YdhW family putative oxidoreductase system protein [Brenneria goodwinii]MCG8175543.1 YdhW family putative oxidoreductase system protein [Brenneria goodwini